MLFKNSLTKESLLICYLKNETSALYTQGINKLRSLRFEVIGMIILNLK